VTFWFILWILLERSLPKNQKKFLLKNFRSVVKYVSLVSCVRIKHIGISGNIAQSSLIWCNSLFVHGTWQSLLDIALRSTAATSDPSHEDLTCCVVIISLDLFNLILLFLLSNFFTSMFNRKEVPSLRNLPL
jgi:hypothetical protein